MAGQKRRAEAVKEPSWAFDATSLSLDERYGYARSLWPRAREAMGIGPGMRVLDVGCGPGALTRFIAGSLEGRGEVVGVDHDPALLERAREATPATGGVRVRFEAADALQLPFEDDAFDAVVSAFMLCVIPDPLAALREMRRVARPGGVVASVSCFCKSGILPSFRGLHDFEGVERHDALRRRFLDARRERIRNPALGLPSGRDLDVWGDYHRAGLTDLRIHGHLTVFAPSDARWSDEEARDYVEGRRRVELGLLDGLAAGHLETLEAAGFGRDEARELRELTARKYAWLLEDVQRIRRGMEVFVEPAVLITGRAPRPGD